MNATRPAEVKRPVNVKRLQDLLQAAVELELATIPFYLCAIYSLRPGSNDEVGLIIRSVVVEEMLHMALAANVLNAIGGEPRVTGTAHVPQYPHELPDGTCLTCCRSAPRSSRSSSRSKTPSTRTRCSTRTTRWSPAGGPSVTSPGPPR